MTTKNKKTFGSNSRQNIAEAPLEGILGGVVDSVKNQLVRESVNTAWRQLLGGKDYQPEQPQGKRNQANFSGDLSEGQEIDLSKKLERIARMDPGIDYRGEIIHAETRILRSQNQQLETKVQEIIIELKKLSKSSKELSVTFKDVSVTTVPVSPGKYHLNFFEWVLQTISEARMKIENSSAWLNAVSKKKGKKDFWSMAKSSGTSFSLSGERAVSQQVG